jgi:hypothetical protein
MQWNVSLEYGEIMWSMWSTLYLALFMLCGVFN